MKHANFDFQPKGFTPFKGRTLAYGQTVKVYRNLHKKTFSVVDVATGLVLGYCDTITLRDATFTVQEAGRQRVLKERRKNVHAYVIGTFEGTQGRAQRHEAFYNPYKYESFVTTTETPLYKAASVTLDNGKTYYTGRTD